MQTERSLGVESSIMQMVAMGSKGLGELYRSFHFNEISGSEEEILEAIWSLNKKGLVIVSVDKQVVVRLTTKGKDLWEKIFYANLAKVQASIKHH